MINHLSKNQRILAVILGVSFLFRIHGLSYGLPLEYAVPDEYGHYLGSLYLLANHTFKIPFYHVVGAYLTTPLLVIGAGWLSVSKGLSSIEGLRNFILTHPGTLLP